MKVLAPLDDWPISARHGANFGYLLPNRLLAPVVHPPRFSMVIGVRI
jgi:hypothetical protein